MNGGQFFIIEEQVILLLFIASLVGIAARRLRMPYTVGLVLVGLGLTLVGQVQFEISSDLILGLLIPPLVFEAAYHLNFLDLQRNLKPILILAIPGVLVTTFLVGGVVSLGTGYPLNIALLSGALVAATDPDAVIALIRSLGVPKRLQILLEGESLLNDGTVIVVFNLMLAIVISGQFNLITSLTQFFTIAGGGLAIGFILGWLFSQMISRINDHLLETTLTSVLAFGAYLFAESLGTSGVMAVVAAGLVNGNIGSKGMSPTTRIVVFNFWEYAAFLATTFIFLLIGLQIDISMLVENWQLIFWAIIAVLVARAVVVYGFSIFNREIPLRWQHVLYWGGLRGALAPALAISLPDSLGPLRGQIQAMVFGVVLFNLIIQGTTLGPFVRRLNLVQRSLLQDEYERRHARAVATRASYDHIEARFREGLISDKTWQTLSRLLKSRHLALIDAVSEVMSRSPEVEAEELDTAWRETLRSQRSTYSNLLTDGIITEDTFERLIGEVDLALMESQINWSEFIQSEQRLPIKSLITVMVQHFDEENVINVLNRLGFSVTRLPNEERLLQNSSTTLLIGAPEGREELVIQTLEENCFPSTKNTSQMPFRETTPENVTDIYIFDVERFLEL
jgi:CPA1 family monovalent cation:H+ antiporter